ncbi:uncharacterized protein [Emydura macquarii macquarii]|uniref:uncharacterized protein isoform X2 n=1 Tax=Emydura macquarii macquarii TaxID=1129001 RepID=UPI003529DE00
MDPLTVPPVSSRPPVLQLFRNLFGLRQSTPEGPEIRADGQERGDVRDQEENSSLVPAVANSQTSQPAGKELKGDHSTAEPHGETKGNRMEEILGELKDVSLGGSPSSSGRGSPHVLDPSGTGMGDSGDWALSELSESGSCVDPSVGEEEQIMGSGATGGPGRRCSGTGDAEGASADRWLLGRTSVLQLFRNLFGLRQSRLKVPETRADAQDRGDVRDQEENSSLVPVVADSQPSQPAGKELKGNHLTNEPCGDATDNCMEEILGEMKDISLRDTPSSSGRRSPRMLDHRGMEMGDSGGFLNTAMSKENKAAQDPCSRISGREVERMGEASGDTGMWGKAGISQVLRADNQGITLTAGPLAMTPKDFHTKEEKERLLKEDLNGGSPKAELSPWNKLINVYKQRRKLPVPKFHLHENPAQLGMEEGSTLNVTVYGFASSESHLISSKSSSTALIYRLPDGGAGETVVGHFGRTQVDLRANALREPEAD